jgi:hypothetical protein
MADFLSLYGHNIGSTSGGGGTGGGHEIVNASGTSLPQEDKLQFTGGLKATDDSTNGKTVVDDSATEITFTQWNNMTPQQQAAIPKALITEVPSVDGGIQADLMTKLWENDSPSSAFAAQSITLASSDYDFLIWVYNANNESTISASTMHPKGGIADMSFYFATSNVPARTRTANYIDDTHYSVRACYTTTSATNNTYNIPIAIYGIKKTINLEFSAIASNVGTLASNCMADDEATSMQDVTDSIAPTDTTPATAAHAIGDQFYFNGQLVTATAAIAIGDAVAVGTNCTASDTVVEQMETKTPYINLSATTVTIDQSYAGSTSGTLYTTTGDGWVRVVIQRKSGTGIGRLYADGVYIGAIGTGDVQLWIPLKKGTVFTYNVDSNTTCRFVLAIQYN